MRNRELDPRLRKLVTFADNTDRLRAEMRRNVAADGPELAAAPEISADTVSSRVLVQLVTETPPAAFADLRWNQVVDRIFVVEIPIARLEELAADPAVQSVEAGKTLAPNLSTSVAETRADRVHAGPPGRDGTGVVVGIIDFGCDFTMDDFRNPDGTTRLAFLWDQFLTPAGAEQSPASFGFGVEYDRAALDAALTSADPFSTVRHSPGAGSHGTHVAGTAAGNGRSGDAAFPAGQFIGTAPGSTIIFVQPAATDQTSTFTDSVHVAEAVAYVFQKADQLGLPCVINMSLGQNGGSHDGESIVERAIDRLLERPGRAMVLAAGNEHIFRGHSAGQLAAGGTRSLRWRVGGQLELPGGGVLPPGFGDFTPNEMEIWYSSRDLFRMRLTDPDGEQTPLVRPGETIVHNFASGDVAFIDSERFTVLNGDARIYIEISNLGGTLKTGVWNVELEAEESRDGRFDAWIERDRRLDTNQFADQSFFVGTDFDEVRTLGTPATGRRTIAVANYGHVSQSPSSSSGRGTTRDGRQKPEVAAPGTAIRSCNSLGGRPNPASPGTNLPMRVTMSGTSMAAPHVTGIAALLFEIDRNLTADQVRKILVASASPPPGIQPFDPAWGFGRVDAEAAVALLE